MTETIYGKYLIFDKENEKCWIIFNKKKEMIGRIEKEKVGRWTSWVLLLDEGYYMSASCLDETRDHIKFLNSCLNKVKE